MDWLDERNISIRGSVLSLISAIHRNSSSSRPEMVPRSYRVVNRIIEFLLLFRTRVELQTGIMGEYIVPCPGGRRTTLCNCISARGQIDDLLISHFANLRTTYSTMKTTVLQFFRRILIRFCILSCQPLASESGLPFCSTHPLFPPPVIDNVFGSGVNFFFIHRYGHITE